MDFNFKRPSHIFALVILILVLSYLIGSSIYYYFTPLSISTDYTGNFSEVTRIVFQIILLVVQLLVVLAIFVGVPLLWYFAVNRLSLREMLYRMKFRRKGIDMAALWGFITAVVMFAIIFAIGIAMTQIGIDTEELGNIEDLEQLFSLPAMFILVAVQPITEEIFFRGFLLEKIHALAGKEIAIVVTSVLFGVVHLSYGNVYPALMAGLLGVILAIAVIKTKNLMTSVIAHTLYNIASVALYVIAKSLLS